MYMGLLVMRRLNRSIDRLFPKSTNKQRQKHRHHHPPKKKQIRKQPKQKQRPKQKQNKTKENTKKKKKKIERTTAGDMEAYKYQEAKQTFGCP